jgi:hypothetical protein
MTAENDRIGDQMIAAADDRGATSPPRFAKPFLLILVIANPERFRGEGPRFCGPAERRPTNNRRES